MHVQRLSAATRTIDTQHPSVEQGAIEWYQQNGVWSHASHAENSVWLTLFGVRYLDDYMFICTLMCMRVCTYMYMCVCVPCQKLRVCHALRPQG